MRVNVKSRADAEMINLPSVYLPKCTKGKKERA